MYNTLITGHQGLLGSALVNYLHKNTNQRLIGISRSVLDTYTLKNLDILDKIITVHGDITDFKFVNSIITRYEINYIYNLAAHAAVRVCERNPIDAFNVNIMGSVNIFESARQSKNIKGIIQMSSDKYYGQIKELPYTEDMKPNPKGVYEVSKTSCDFVGKSYGQNFNLSLIMVRGANLFGPRDLNLSRLIPGSIVRMLNNESPIVYNDTKNYIREFLFVDDAARILYELINVADKYKGEAVNLGSGFYLQIKHLVYRLIKLFGSDLEIKFPVKENPFFEIDKQYLDLTKLHSMIGEQKLKTNENLDGCLLDTIKWYKKYLNE